MKKPRMIIADADRDYVMMLLNRFVTDYFDSIDYEVITEKSFLRTLFSSPQDVDVLIVSASFYAEVSQRNYIKHAFVLIENKEQALFDDIGVIQIPKYNSIKEIIAQIIGRCSEVFHHLSSQKKGSKIVVVFSAAGGVGKTTISLGISAYLSSIFKRVLYINAAQIQTFQYRMKKSRSISAGDVFSVLNENGKKNYDSVKTLIQKESFSYLRPFCSSLLSLDLDFSIYRDVALTTKNSDEFDLILVDLEIGLDDEKVKLLDLADKVLIVTRPDTASLFATNHLTDNISGASSERFIYICNNTMNSEANVSMDPEFVQKYYVSSYIPHFPFYEKMSIQDISTDKDIQRVAHLLI